MSGRPTTSIYIRVKRMNDTWFLLCDEYETVESLKNRILLVLQKIGLQLPKQEEPFTVDDIRLWLKNRVSNVDFCCRHNTSCQIIKFESELCHFRCWTIQQLATINKFLMTQKFSFVCASQAPRINLKSLLPLPTAWNSFMTTRQGRKKSQRRRTEPN